MEKSVGEGMVRHLSLISAPFPEERAPHKNSVGEMIVLLRNFSVVLNLKCLCFIVMNGGYLR